MFFFTFSPLSLLFLFCILWKTNFLQMQTKFQLLQLFSMHTPTLPVLRYEKEINSLINAERVSVISGKTGCGKSTQIPQMILRSNPKAKIAICEPRRIAATSLAHRVSSQMRKRLGDLVGYHIGMESKLSDKTQIVFITYGILIQKLMHNEKLEYSHIILDEVHERSLQMDYTFITLKKILGQQRQKQMKIIIMSATINSKQFRKYFATHKTSNDFYKPDIKYDFTGVRDYLRDQQIETLFKYPNISNYRLAGGFDIPEERTFGIDIFFLDDFDRMTNYEEIVSNPDSNNIQITHKGYKLAVEMIGRFYSGGRGDVLVFLPGINEIKKLKGYLLNSENSWMDGKKIVFVHSAFSDKMHEDLFRTEAQKIILATNMGESSVTLPQCKMVVDFGLTRKNITSNDSRGFNYFCTMKASKSNLIQRAGRVGRVSRGQVFRFMPKAVYHELSEFETPQIQMVSLEMTILKIKMMDKTFKGSVFEDPYDLLMSAMEPPNPVQVHKAIHFLLTEKALLNSSRIGGQMQKYVGKHLKLSQVGHFMANIPCSFDISKMILLSLRLGIPKTMVDIGSILMSTKKFFLSEDRRKSDTFLTNQIKFDKGNYNDFFMKKRLFDEWKKKFFFPFAKEYLERKANERERRRNEENDEQATISMIQDEDLDNLEEEDDGFIERFCSQRVSENEKEWMNQRGLHFGNMREVLKINENIRSKLLRYNFVLAEEEEKAPNYLVVMCLTVAFPRVCKVDFQSDEERNEKNFNPIQKEAQKSIILKATEDISREQLIDEIHLFLYPKKPDEIKNVGRTFVEVKADEKSMQKLRLDLHHKPHFQCSPAFYRVLQNKKNFGQVQISQDIVFELKKVKISNQSILSTNIIIDQTLPHFVISDSIIHSKNNIHLSSAVLVNGQSYYLIQMLTCQELKLGKSAKLGFIHAVKIDGRHVNLPFQLTEQMLNDIRQMRKVCTLFGKEGKMERQFNEEEKKRLARILTADGPEHRMEIWQGVYRSQHRKFQPALTEYTLLQPETKIESNFQAYYEDYKNWKAKEYTDFYYMLKTLTLKTPRLVCKQCLLGRCIKIFGDINWFDFEKKFLRIDKSSKKYKIKNSKLYCRNNHKLGFLYSDDQAVLFYSKIFIYVPFKKFLTFDPNMRDTSKILREVENGMVAFEDNRKQFYQAACRMCSQYSFQKDRFEKFCLNREPEDNIQDYVENLKLHINSKIHKMRTRKFLKNIDL